MDGALIAYVEKRRKRADDELDFLFSLFLLIVMMCCNGVVRFECGEEERGVGGAFFDSREARFSYFLEGVMKMEGFVCPYSFTDVKRV